MGAIIRYEKADNLLQLALAMQVSRVGLSLEDIMRQAQVGRRTAMRMRDALLRNFPQIEEVAGDERVKRWRIPPGTLDRLVAVTTDELAALEKAARRLAQDNRELEAAEVAGIALKLRALMKPEVARRVEPDLETLLEAEGLAARPGPRPRIDVTVVEALRQAMLAFRKVAISYRNRKTGAVKERLVHPYGFLHGHRHYLIAWHENPKANRVVLFSLPNIEAVRLLADGFTREPGFDLQRFADQSFGVFQAEPFETVWRFAPEVADDAAEFIFHPAQTLERQRDGALLVRFTAASDLEMAWHLYSWGDKVEVLAPPALAALVNPRRVPWPATP